MRRATNSAKTKIVGTTVIPEATVTVPDDDPAVPAVEGEVLVAQAPVF